MSKLIEVHTVYDSGEVRAYIAADKIVWFRQCSSGIDSDDDDYDIDAYNGPVTRVQTIDGREIEVRTTVEEFQRKYLRATEGDYT